MLCVKYDVLYVFFVTAFSAARLRQHLKMEAKKVVG